MTSPREMLARFRRAIAIILNVSEKFDEIKINQGLILSMLNAGKLSKNIRDYEFKVFSQWGEDGIIQHLARVVEIKNKTFIEFGVEDFMESNCRFLMMKDGWQGFVIDGAPSNIARLRESYFYWKYGVEARAAFVTAENINDLLAESGFEADLGILSIDLDGNDYYVLEAISFFQPRILICEYNPVFGPDRKISIPYRPDFNRTAAHHSNLYWGASLSAMTHIADKKGYSLVGTNSAGNNAFYVRKDLLNDKLEVLSVRDAYTPSNFRESRDKDGNLTHLSAGRKLEAIKGLPVIEVEKNVAESV